jgi:hypothetical protein
MSSTGGWSPSSPAPNKTDFLKIDSTAPNSSELGGLTPDAFFQGTGHVVTGAISSLAQNGVATGLLTVPGGIGVSIINAAIGDGGLQVQISNPTGATLTTVVNNSGTMQEHDLSPVSGVNPNGTTSFVFMTTGAPPIGELHIQIFPNAGLAQVVTLIISADSASFVGQAFSGPS